MRRRARPIPTGKVAYVVHARNWEYNDEYNVDRGVGESKQAFLSKERADAECEKLNIQALKDQNIGDYGGEDQQVFTTDMEIAVEKLVALGIAGPKMPKPKPADPKKAEAAALRAKLRSLGERAPEPTDDDDDPRASRDAIYEWLYKFSLPKDMPDDKAREALALIAIRFYEVVPVSLDDVTA